MGVSGKIYVPAALPPGKNPRPGGFQCRSGRLQKMENTVVLSGLYPERSGP